MLAVVCVRRGFRDVGHPRASGPSAYGSVTDALYLLEIERVAEHDERLRVVCGEWVVGEYAHVMGAIGSPWESFEARE